jgi:predicted transcriptional regulator
MTHPAGAIGPNGRDLAEGGASNLPNAERYRHIPTAEIIKLSDEQDLSQRKIGKLLGMGPCAVGNRLRAAGKARRPPKLTPSQLEECRQDPAYEARPHIANKIVPANRVVCRECGELKSELNASGDHGSHSHLWGKHKLTADGYKSKWPGASLTSFARSADHNRRQGYKKTLQQLMDEIATNYLSPEERTEALRDQEWEEHHGIAQLFIVCRLCGMKSKTHLHNHLKTQHGLTSAAYYKQFPKCLRLPLGLYDAKNKLAKTYGRKKSKLATQGKILAAVASMNPSRQKIAIALLIDRSSGNEQVKQLVLKLTGESVSTSTVERVRAEMGLARKKGRPAQNL